MTIVGTSYLKTWYATVVIDAAVCTYLYPLSPSLYAGRDQRYNCDGKILVLFNVWDYAGFHRSRQQTISSAKQSERIQNDLIVVCLLHFVNTRSRRKNV